MSRGRLNGTETGQNLIEFALLTPVVLLFIAAIVIFGIAVYTRASLQQAVREGGRQAAVGKMLAEVQDVAAGNAADQLDAEDVQWCLPSGSTGRVGEQLRVYIDDGNDGSEGYDFVLSAPGGIFSIFNVPPLTVTMRPRAEVRLEKSLPNGAAAECT